jgi:hypothetical protein
MTNHVFVPPLRSFHNERGGGLAESGARQSVAGVCKSGVRPSQYLAGVHAKFVAFAGRNRAIKIFAADTSTIAAGGIANATAFATC